MVLVKKYKNRKLYSNGSYIQFDTLFKYLKDGVEFKILCGYTGLDITSSTIRRMALKHLETSDVSVSLALAKEHAARL